MKSLADNNHIVRYCKRSTLDDNNLPSPASFELRKKGINGQLKDETYLSVVWQENLSKKNKSPTIQNCLFELNFSKIPTNGGLAQFNVKKIKGCVSDKALLYIEKTSKDPKDCHSAIYGIYELEDLIKFSVQVEFSRNYKEFVLIKGK